MSLIRIRRWAQHHVVSSAGIVLALLLVAACVLAPMLALFDPAGQNLDLGLTGPSPEHWLGTDHLGRDLLSRLLWAGRASLTATTIVLVLSLAIGVFVGILAGYIGGLVDEASMRLVDLFLAIPTIILALALIGALGPSFNNLIIALSVSWWTPYARLVRSQVLSVRETEYVVAAQALGASSIHIMVRHVLPALIGPVVVLLSLDVGNIVLSIAGLSFLGLGIQPPEPEWGSMLVDARPFMQLAPHLVLAPGIAILITVFGFNSLAEGLDYWLRPWMQVLGAASLAASTDLQKKEERGTPKPSRAETFVPLASERRDTRVEEAEYPLS